MMGPATAIATGFAYPYPGALGELSTALDALAGSPARRLFERFVTEVSRLSLGEWEELHTRTLDLSPAFVPYVGHVTWGENYRRGEFMADLKGEQRACGVDPAGELPDHLEPVLRYLDAAPQPLPDLMEILPGAIGKMITELAGSDRDNPYRHLLAAAASVVDSIVPAGGLA
jgi:nitrate reductase delta subunit